MPEQLICPHCGQGIVVWLRQEQRRDATVASKSPTAVATKKPLTVKGQGLET